MRAPAKQAQQALQHCLCKQPHSADMTEELLTGSRVRSNTLILAAYTGCVQREVVGVPEMEGVRARPNAGRKAPAANGRDIRLYAKAQHKFWRILMNVCLLR